jgi:hypothetical protein
VNPFLIHDKSLEIRSRVVKTQTICRRGEVSVGSGSRTAVVVIDLNIQEAGAEGSSKVKNEQRSQRQLGG